MTSSASGSSAPAAEPSVVDIPDDNTLVKVRGSDKPIKFGDYSRGFQAQATRASQEAARLQRELAAAQQERDRFRQESQARQNAPQGQEKDVYADLQALQYLDGPTFANVVKSIAGQFQGRDKIILGLAQEVQRMQKQLGGLNERHVNSTFNSKIDKFLADGGYGPELRNLAVETYLAYEPGSDLDAEFPRILAERIDEISKYVEAKRQDKLNQTRRQPFIPGKGGQTGPSKPLELDPRASARETAEKLWESMQFGPGT